MKANFKIVVTDKNTKRIEEEILVNGTWSDAELILKMLIKTSKRYSGFGNPAYDVDIKDVK